MSGFGLSSTSMELVKLPSTSMEMAKPSLDNSMMEMPVASVEFERHGFPSRHCDVIPESEEMDTDSSDCDHEEEIVVVEEEEEERRQSQSSCPSTTTSSVLVAAPGHLNGEEGADEDVARDRSEEMSDVESGEGSDSGEDSVARLRAWLEMHRR